MENDILKHRMAVISNIEKSFGEDIVEKGFEDEVNPFEKAKHQDGDMHPNGKWVWRQSANGGKGDWRVANPKRGGGAKKTAAAPTTSTAASQKKEDASAANKKTAGDFDRLSSAKTQLEVNKFWSNLLTSNSGKGQNIAGKLLDSIKESGYRNLSRGTTAGGMRVYTYTNKDDADKNIKILSAIDAVVIKTNDKREVLKVSDFKTVSDFKKKFEETVLGLSGNVSNKTNTTSSDNVNKLKLNGVDITVKRDPKDKYGYIVEGNGKSVKTQDPSYYNVTKLTELTKKTIADMLDIPLKTTAKKKADDKKTYAAKEADAYDKGDGKIGNYPKPTVNVGKPARQLYNMLDKNRHFHFKYGMPSDEIMKKLKTYQGNVVYSYHDNAGTDEIYRIEFK